MEALETILRASVVLAIFWGGAWWLKNRRGMTAARPGTAAAPKVVSRTALSRKSNLTVVDVDGRRLILGATDSTVTLVAETAIPDTDPAVTPFTPVRSPIPFVAAIANAVTAGLLGRKTSGRDGDTGTDDFDSTLRAELDQDRPYDWAVTGGAR